MYKVLLNLLLTTTLAACDPSRLGLPMASPPPAEAPVLKIYNWPDYIPEGLTADFEKETGIRVVYDTFDTFDTFDTDEALNARLLAGQTGHDIVVPGAAFAQGQIAQGLFQPLDKSLLPGLSNLEPGIMQLIGQYDPGNRKGAQTRQCITSGGVMEQLKAQRDKKMGSRMLGASQASQIS